MKTKPILFNTEMVSAILDRRKTQTRRVIKGINFLGGIADLHDPTCWGYEDGDGFLHLLELGNSDRWAYKIPCPYQVSDRLYVRESFTYWEDDEFGGDYLEYRTGHRVSLGEWEYPHPIYDHCIGRFGKWTPSIHAPRWASRITLEITGVRVERIQDISEEDAIAEGIPYQGNPADTIGAFSDLWQSVYSNWDVNPWVWVIEFSPLAIADKEESQ